MNDWCNEVSDWKTLGSDIYIAAQIPANSVNPSMVFEIGDGKTYDGYENKQLSNGLKYKIYSRGLARRATKVNKLNSDVARFTIIVRTCLTTKRLQVFFRGPLKRATSLLNSFCSNVEKLNKLHVFCCPFYRVNFFKSVCDEKLSRVFTFITQTSLKCTNFIL